MTLDLCKVKRKTLEFNKTSICLFPDWLTELQLTGKKYSLLADFLFHFLNNRNGLYLYSSNVVSMIYQNKE